MTTSRGGPKGIPEKLVAAALRKHAGILILAANELKVARQTIWERVQNSAKLQALLKQIEEEHLDIGEGHIISGLRTGDKDWTRYYMGTKGKKRGYGNSLQIGGDDAAIEAIVRALGGSPDAIRGALLRLGHDPEKD